MTSFRKTTGDKSNSMAAVARNILAGKTKSKKSAPPAPKKGWDWSNPPAPLDPVRTCFGCKKEKPADQFPADAFSRETLPYLCNECNEKSNLKSETPAIFAFDKAAADAMFAVIGNKEKVALPDWLPDDVILGKRKGCKSDLTLEQQFAAVVVLVDSLKAIFAQISKKKGRENRTAMDAYYKALDNTWTWMSNCPDGVANFAAYNISSDFMLVFIHLVVCCFNMEHVPTMIGNDAFRKFIYEDLPEKLGEKISDIKISDIDAINCLRESFDKGNLDWMLEQSAKIVVAERVAKKEKAKKSSPTTSIDRSLAAPRRGINWKFPAKGSGRPLRDTDRRALLAEFNKVSEEFFGLHVPYDTPVSAVQTAKVVVTWDSGAAQTFPNADAARAAIKRDLAWRRWSAPGVDKEGVLDAWLDPERNAERGIGTVFAGVVRDVRFRTDVVFGSGARLFRDGSRNAPAHSGDAAWPSSFLVAEDDDENHSRPIALTDPDERFFVTGQGDDAHKGAAQKQKSPKDACFAILRASRAGTPWDPADERVVRAYKAAGKHKGRDPLWLEVCRILGM